MKINHQNIKQRKIFCRNKKIKVYKCLYIILLLIKIKIIKMIYKNQQFRINNYLIITIFYSIIFIL